MEQKRREQSEFIERVININRVTKVTKGGKKLSFTALIVLGDAKGRVGYALGKAHEVADAIRKGLHIAKKNCFSVPLAGTTIPYEVIGHYGAAKVLLKPAAEGTGVIAAGPVRAVCEAAGIKDILSKSLKSNNPLNVVKAAIDGLIQLRAPLHASSVLPNGVNMEPGDTQAKGDKANGS